MTSLARMQDRTDREWSGREVGPVLQGALSLGLVLQVLFLPNTATVGILGILATLALLAIAFSRAVAARMLASLPASAFWLLAMLSTLWSVHPKTTLTYASELAVTTVIAMVVSGISGRRGVLAGLALGMTAYLLISLAGGGSVAMGAHGGEAFSGLTGSKNFLAATAAIAVIASVCALGEAVAERAPARIAGFLVCLPISAWVLIAAKSSGALVETLGVLALVGCLAVMRLLRPDFRLALLLAFGFALALLGVVYLLEREAIEAAVLGAFGKDPTLTGRVYLWQRAEELIAQYPLLGRGYYAFWVQGDLDPEGLWHWAGIANRTGFNFHSTWREIVVAFGWSGLALLGAATAWAIATRLHDCLLGAEFFDIFWLAVMAYFLIGMWWEAVLPVPFSNASLLLLAAYSPFRESVAFRVPSRLPGSGVPLLPA